MNERNLLICVFSYNMGATLENCLSSIAEMCPGFDTVVMDDASDDPATRSALERWRPKLMGVFTNTDPKDAKRHGNLYVNIRRMCDYARLHGYRYLMMLQDDMQFVRPLSPDVLDQYQRIFEADPKTLQVDPRFLRRGDYEVLPKLRAYRYDSDTSYADVGVTDLERLADSGVEIGEGERANKRAFAEKGCRRYFPFTPVAMHVPFPQRYRNGKLKRSLLLWNRGKYGYHPMTTAEMRAMDARDLSIYPHFSRFLRVRNMVVGRIFYHLKRDTAVFT